MSTTNTAPTAETNAQFAEYLRRVRHIEAELGRDLTEEEEGAIAWATKKGYRTHTVQTGPAYWLESNEPYTGQKYTDQTLFTPCVTFRF